MAAASEQEANLGGEGGDGINGEGCRCGGRGRGRRRGGGAWWWQPWPMAHPPGGGGGAWRRGGEPSRRMEPSWCITDPGSGDARRGVGRRERRGLARVAAEEGRGAEEGRQAAVEGES